MKLFRLALILIVSVLLAGCDTDPFRPTQVTFTHAQLQKAVAKKFPIEKHYLESVDLIVSNPVVGLRPETNRIVIQFDAAITVPGATQPINGQLVFSSGLTFDTNKSELVLKDPKLEKQQIAGLSGATGEIISQLEAIVIKDNLNGKSIHNCKPGDLEFLGVPLKPTSVEVTQEGVILHLAK